MKAVKQKLYCYVDENGQDTKGDIFIVSVVVTGKERDELLTLCEEIEQKSGKGKFKWGKAERKLRLEFIKQIFFNKNFRGKLRYSIYRDQTSYDLATLLQDLSGMRLMANQRELPAFIRRLKLTVPWLKFNPKKTTHKGVVEPRSFNQLTDTASFRFDLSIY